MRIWVEFGMLAFALVGMEEEEGDGGGEEEKRKGRKGERGGERSGQSFCSVCVGVCILDLTSALYDSGVKGIRREGGGGSGEGRGRIGEMLSTSQYPARRYVST